MLYKIFKKLHILQVGPQCGVLTHIVVGFSLNRPQRGKPEIILLSLGIGISKQSQALAVWDINDWDNLGRKVGEGILSGMKIPVINKVLTLGF